MASPFMAQGFSLRPWQDEPPLRVLQGAYIPDQQQQHHGQQQQNLGGVPSMHAQGSGTSCTLACAFDDVLQGLVVDDCPGGSLRIDGNSKKSKRSGRGTCSSSNSSPTSIRMISTLDELTAPSAGRRVVGNYMQQQLLSRSSSEESYSSSSNSLLGLPLLKAQQPMGRFATGNPSRSNSGGFNRYPRPEPASWNNMGGWNRYYQLEEVGLGTGCETWAPSGSSSPCAEQFLPSHVPRVVGTGLAGHKRPAGEVAAVGAGSGDARGAHGNWSGLQRKRGRSWDSDFDWCI
jgi:hypothetical protein